MEKPKKASDILKKSEYMDYINKNIQNVTLLLGSSDVRTTQHNDPIIIAGILEFDNNTYGVLYKPNTMEVMIEHLDDNPRRPIDITTTSQIEDDALFYLLVSKMQDLNLINNYDIMRLLGKYIKKEVFNSEEEYTVLREAIEMARHNTITVYDLKNIMFSSSLSNRQKFEQLRDLVLLKRKSGAQNG